MGELSEFSTHNVVEALLSEALRVSAKKLKLNEYLQNEIFLFVFNAASPASSISVATIAYPRPNWTASPSQTGRPVHGKLIG
jgi:hypothetical protein